MLVLSRKPGESIHIGDDVVVTVVRVGPNAVRLGVSAPRDVPIVREELNYEPQHPVAAEAATDVRHIEPRKNRGYRG
jgi:carbon storage regulator